MKLYSYRKIGINRNYRKNQLYEQVHLRTRAKDKSIERLKKFLSQVLLMVKNNSKLKLKRLWHNKKQYEVSCLKR